MDLEKLTNILEKIFKESLEEKRYHFGLDKRKGISDKIASGSLRNSVKAIPGENEIGIEMNSYWRFVQSGRLRGKKRVPISEIEKWIDQRGLTGKTKEGKKMTRRQFAFAIQTNIRKFGIPSKPGFLDVVINKMYESTELSNILGDITVDELIDKMEGL